jgi:O-antigen/teichoic acid export membrane protein
MEAVETIRAEDSESLLRKVIHGGLWVFALRIVNRGLGFIRTIILARLLAPTDFGLFGIAILAISTLETLSQTGFHSALIQKKNNVESYLNVAWTVSVIRGILVFLVLLIFAPVIANFFNSPQTSSVIRLIAITAFCSGCTNIGVILFQKDLEFKKKFTYEFSGTIVDLTVALSLGFLLQSVWALVLAGVLAGFTRLFMSYVISSHRPKFEFNIEKFLCLFGFGKWVYSSSVLVFLITSGDDLFVAKMLGITSLGLYQMAYLISNLPSTEIAHVISQVTFPAYSKMQSNLSKLKEAYIKVLKFTAFTSIPLAGSIYILAPDFSSICLGNKWEPIIPIVQILVFTGLLRSLAATSGSIFHGLGKPKIDTGCQIIRLFTLATLIFPFTILWGIQGTSIAVLISIMISTLCFFVMIKKTIDVGINYYFKILGPPLIHTAIMVIIVYALKYTIRLASILEFSGLVGFCLLINLVLAFMIEKCFNYEVIKTIKQSLI